MLSKNPQLIYETLHGSRAYNLHGEASDYDYKGILVGPSAWYYGFRGGPEQIEHNADRVHYEIRKFFCLGANANPTLLEILWTDPQDHTLLTPAGERLLDSRQAFLSKQVEQSFGRYALSQLKRIKTHRRWLLNPPQQKPSRAQYQLPERSLIAKDQLGAAEALIGQKKLKEAELSDNFLEILDRERRYGQAQREWEQYQTWLKNRNPKRASLEERFGYDTKHAMHLVRLQKMAIEILSQEKVLVKRSDREALLAIREGTWSYEELLEKSEHLAKDIEQAAQLSKLPQKPDLEILDKLCMSLVEEVLRAQA